MKKENLFKGLKWLFTGLMVVTGFAVSSILMVAVLLHGLDVSQFTVEGAEVFSSPVFTGLMVLNYSLFTAIFYLARRLFKNFQLGEIFGLENQKLAKILAGLLAVLTFTNGVPDLAFHSYTLNLNYLIIGIVIWIVAEKFIAVEQTSKFA